MFLIYYICHSQIVDHLETERSLLISFHHSFSTKALVTIVELYFYEIYSVRLF